MVVLGFMLIAGGSASAQLAINGAGATFPYPLYTRWFNTYARVDSAVRFNYRAIGSGAGINEILARSIDFGASDAPLSDQQLAAAPGKILHFPTVLGADVITYNLPALEQKLRFTGPLIADIFLGKITNWNDSRIAEANPGVKLPDRPIVVCHRSDGSGTTYVFTDYLSKVSPDWKQKIGAGTSVTWPTGQGGEGNQGVIDLVKHRDGAIAYVELAYTLSNKLPVALLRNHDGKWIEPNIRSITSAAASAAANMPSDFRVSITDAAGAESYPVSSFTYLLVYQQQSDAAKGKALRELIQWALRDGQTFAPPLSYAPLPGTVIAAEENQIKTIELPPQ